MLKKLALIGYDVSKSLSPQIHRFIASRFGYEVKFDKISIPERDFEKQIDGLFQIYDGVNVTIPYKLSVMPHLKSIEGDAKIFGAVNTVNCKTLTGYNTDGHGFMLMLKRDGVHVRDKRVLVLGAGGAGRSVSKKLLDAGTEVYVYNRHPEKAKELEREFKGLHALTEIEVKPYYLIVNATGVGMHETEGQSPVDEKILEPCDVAVDLIYVPKKSEFLRLAEAKGKQIINGEAMLFYQAYYSDCVFFGLRPDEDTANKLFTEFCEVKK